MANEEQLSILKQGNEVWNQWRNEDDSETTKIDLSESDLHGVNLVYFNLSDANLMNANLADTDLNMTNLSEANLSGVNLWKARLGGVNLFGANLNGANLIRADLFRVDLSNADLSNADLNGASLDQADLSETNLHEANLNGANLNGAYLRETNLSRANLNEANLRETNFNRANLNEADLTAAEIGETVFGGIDLSKTLGLEDIRHGAPSYVDTHTIQLSRGKIPEIFLRGCGFSDSDIQYAKLSDRELSNEEINKILYKIYDLRATQALQISPLFISYSHGDGKFVDKVGGHLNSKGIRFWRDVYDAKAGRLEKQIDRAMRLNPTVLLILSKHSLQSDWVEHEVRTARALEKEIKRDVICPVALDDSWINSPWAKRIMEQIMEYNILDFSEWKDDTKFENAFNKLIDGLELFYK